MKGGRALSVVAKSLELLNLFSEEQPELGLSQLYRLAKRDKATVYRHLSALEDLGFVEQNPITKAYRLGPAVLSLAQLREKTVPRKKGAEGPLATLAEAVGETCHVSVLSGKTLHALMDRESTVHSTRAVIDMEVLPLHATASGICAIAFGPEGLFEAACADMTRFTETTMVDPESLRFAVQRAKESGFALGDRGYGDDTHGVAAPLFDQTGVLAGTVAVASVANRMTPDSLPVIQQHLTHAAEQISRNWGGAVPPAITTLWAETVRSRR